MDERNLERTQDTGGSSEQESRIQLEKTIAELTDMHGYIMTVETQAKLDDLQVGERYGGHLPDGQLWEVYRDSEGYELTVEPDPDMQKLGLDAA
jgi:hypothetical protein